MEKEIPL